MTSKEAELLLAVAEAGKALFLVVEYRANDEGGDYGAGADARGRREAAHHRAEQRAVA